MSSPPRLAGKIRCTVPTYLSRTSARRVCTILCPRRLPDRHSTFEFVLECTRPRLLDHLIPQIRHPVPLRRPAHSSSSSRHRNRRCRCCSFHFVAGVRRCNRRTTTHPSRLTSQTKRSSECSSLRLARKVIPSLVDASIHVPAPWLRRQWPSAGIEFGTGRSCTERMAQTYHAVFCRQRRRTGRHAFRSWRRQDSCANILTRILRFLA